MGLRLIFSLVVTLVSWLKIFDLRDGRPATHECIQGNNSPHRSQSGKMTSQPIITINDGEQTLVEFLNDHYGTSLSHHGDRRSTILSFAERLDRMERMMKEGIPTTRMPEEQKESFNSKMEDLKRSGAVEEARLLIPALPTGGYGCPEEFSLDVTSHNELKE